MILSLFRKFRKVVGTQKVFALRGVIILDECKSIRRDRGETYGDFRDNLDSTVEILQTDFDIDFSRADVLRVMIANKRAREKFQHKDDNLVDEINYLAELAAELREKNSEENKIRRALLKMTPAKFEELLSKRK